jgi:hypothetical protein
MMVGICFRSFLVDTSVLCRNLQVKKEANFQRMAEKQKEAKTAVSLRYEIHCTQYGPIKNVHVIPLAW